MTLTEQLTVLLRQAELRWTGFYESGAVDIVDSPRTQQPPFAYVEFGGSDERGIDFRLGELVVIVAQPYGVCWPERLVADVARVIDKPDSPFSVISVLNETAAVPRDKSNGFPLYYAHALQVRSRTDWREASEQS